ncbi:hypothetical protein B0T21DRAFT_31157 [Apiosordaria backusii]|uniref:Uncharacterized protein n=1 Tax=Apiosordaria backusii TaxID=314023 RepID=A0AA40B2B2_9PEZI|nr:hypothetical protein B0T21DRAFT_31157 [Apiosordaria backusii]
MSAQSISRIWALLDRRKDNAHLILELIGSHSLAQASATAVAPSQSLSQTHDITRQLLVRIKVVTDCTFRSLVLQNINPHETSTSVLHRDLYYDLLLHILYLGTWITTPPQTLTGSTEYALQRSLFFTLFLSTFRSWCILFHDEGSGQGKCTLVRGRIQQMAQTWTSHQALSPVESLVLEHLVPTTLEMLQDPMRNGSLKTFCCQWHIKEIPCLDPADPERRTTSLRACRDVMPQIVRGLQESNWVESCWTICDMAWALVDMSIRRAMTSTPNPQAPEIEATTELWGTVREIQDSIDPATRNGLLCRLFSDSIAGLSSQSWNMVPANMARLDEVQQCLELEVERFKQYMSGRDDALKPYFNIPTGASQEAIQSAPPHPMIYSPMPVGQPKPFDQSDPRFSKDSTASNPTAVDDPGAFSRAPSRSTNSQSPRSLLSATHATPLDGPAPKTNRQKWPNIGSTPSPFQESEAGGAVLRPIDEHAPWNITRGLVPPSVSSHSFSENNQTHQRTHHSPSPSEMRLGTTELRPGSRATEHSSGYTPQGIQPSSLYAESIAPSSKTSRERKGGLGLRGLLGAMKKEKVPSVVKGHGATSLPVIGDLGFCFSNAGTSLLLWEKKQPEYLVRLHWPFEDGQKLNLRSFSPNAGNLNLIEDGAGSWTVKLVESGTNLVAAVVSVNRTYKLLYFDGSGTRREIPLPQPGVLPISLAVSRDETKIAVGCGTTIFLYGVYGDTHQLVNSIPAHANPRKIGDNRRRQRMNFSGDSSMLVTATQEPLAPDEMTGKSHGQDTQVHVCLWRLDGVMKLELELQDVFLSLGRGNDPGISSIHCSQDPGSPSNIRLLLTAESLKEYNWILLPGNRHRRIPLSEKRIGTAAQSPTPNGQFVFKNGAHDLCLLDIRTGIAQTLANFADERRSMKMGQEGMAVAFPRDGLALAFWKRDGELVMKQVDIDAGTGRRVGEVRGIRELQAVYWLVVSRG